MALLIRGKSICWLCGQTIGENDDVVATPAFLGSKHRLVRFSDAAFHQKCFEASEERAEVEQLLARFKEKMAAAPSSLEEYEVWIKEAMAEFE